jgi:hypothetical protein
MRSGPGVGSVTPGPDHEQPGGDSPALRYRDAHTVKLVAVLAKAVVDGDDPGLVASVADQAAPAAAVGFPATAAGRDEDSRPWLEVDHVGDPDDHADENLRALCATRHATRTARQARARQTTRRRPVERHPGIVRDQ